MASTNPQNLLAVVGGSSFTPGQTGQEAGGKATSLDNSSLEKQWLSLWEGTIFPALQPGQVGIELHQESEERSCQQRGGRADQEGLVILKGMTVLATSLKAEGLLGSLPLTCMSV